MIKKIIIFGDQLYKSEDGYINYGLHKALTSIGYDTHIVNKYNIKDFGDTENMYIINNLNDNEIIPLNNTNYYVLIKYSSPRFSAMQNKLTIIEYSATIDKNLLNTYTHSGNYVYQKNQTIIMPWGSLLTPVEIIENLHNFVELKDREDIIYMTRNYDAIMLRKANASDIKIHKKKMITLEKEKKIIEESKFSYCLSKTPGKIDYKVITHLSYGAMCITDCLLTHQYLDNKLCFIDDNMSMKTLTENYYDTFKKNNLFDLMENICNNHTFSHRVKHILDYFNL